MAVETSVATSHMVRQRHIAVGAFHRQAAAAAADEGIVAAPVHQQHRLFTAGHAIAQLLHQHAGEHTAIAVFYLPAHVHHGDLRHGPVVDAVGHFQQGIVAAPRLGEGQDARRRGGQQQRRALVFRAEGGYVPRIVAGMAVAQIGRFVFLVHHDDAKILAGREHRAACADDHLCLSVADAPPLIKALTCRQTRMQHRRRVAEARPEPADHLRGQRDLRHEDDGGFAHRQHMTHQADEDLCLAAARHAVEQVFPPPRTQIRQHNVQRLLLISRQRRIDHLVAIVAGGPPQHLLLHQADKADLLQRVKRLHRVAHQDAQLLHRMDLAVPEQVEQHPPLL